MSILKRIQQRLQGLRSRWKNPTSQPPTVKKVHKLTKQIRFIDVMNFVAVAVVMGYLLFSFFYPYKTVDITNLNEDGKVPTVTKEVPAGGYLRYRVHQFRHTDRTATIVRNLVNGSNFPLNASLSNAPAGYQEYIIEVQIPESTDPGVYHVRVTTEFEFALDRIVRVVYQTEDFKVVKPTDPYEPPEEDPGLSSNAPGTDSSSEVRTLHTPENTPDPNEELAPAQPSQPTTQPRRQTPSSEPEPEPDPDESVPPREEDHLLCLPLVNICVL